MNINKNGIVYLVGAGPGDPDLITVKGMECIKKSDVIIYDYLASEKLLKFAKPGVEIILAAAMGHKTHADFEKTCFLMIKKAKEGKIVTRLKGGDPFVFGRGGEEAGLLAEQNILFEIIPGITSAIAVPAYAGIPVTHRGFSSTVTLITGHKCKHNKNINWTKLANSADTLVFYMSLANLNFIQENLLGEGKSPDTPAAVIFSGTKPSQSIIIGTLGTIINKVRDSGSKPPAIIVMGEVVKLRDKLRWFDIKPLFGKKIVVTRAPEQSMEFVESLEKEGAEVIEFPTIEIVPLSDYSELKIALEKINKYNWLIFTSVNGVKYFFKYIKSEKKDIRILSGLKICAIGPATSRELEDKGINVDYLPEEFKAEGIISGFEKMGSLKDLNILLPRAALAREILPEKLRELGAYIDVIPVYENVIPKINTEYIKEKLSKKEIDLITFTSSSTVTNFFKIFEKEKEIFEFLKSCKIASIGPITKETIKKFGLDVSIMPEQYTVPALSQAIKEFYKNNDV